jgi:hypothetical protein
LIVGLFFQFIGDVEVFGGDKIAIGGVGEVAVNS